MENFSKGAYKIIFPNGHFYIGSAYGKMGFEGRWRNHRNGYRNSPKYLQELAARCGWGLAQFVVLKVAKDRHRALLWEQAYINKYSKDLMLVNISRNVFEAPSTASEETRRKLSEAGKGRKHSEETKRRIGISNTGKIISEETRKKISEANKGEKHCFYGKKRPEHSEKMKGENNPSFGSVCFWRGKKRPGHAEKMKGRTASDETRKKLSKANSGENNAMAKLTWEQVNEIRSKYKRGVWGYGYKALAEEYNTTPMSIKYIVTYKQWIPKDDEQTITS